ncbi:MAG: histidine kinase [Flavobacteriaceae bacterium]
MKKTTLNIIFLLSFLNIFSQGTMQRIPMDFDPIHPRINSLVKNEKDLLLIGSSNGLYQYNGYNLDHLIKQPQIPDIRISALYPLEKDKILVGTRHGAYLYQGYSKSIDTVISAQEITYISAPNSTDVFLGTRNFEIYYFDKETQNAQRIGKLNGFKPQEEKIERIQGSLENLQITVTNLLTKTSKLVHLNGDSSTEKNSFYTLQNQHFAKSGSNQELIKNLPEYISHLGNSPYNNDYNYETQSNQLIKLTSILKESDNLYWIGTTDGLYKFRTPIRGIQEMFWGKLRGLIKSTSGTLYACLPNDILTLKNGLISHISWPEKITSRPYSLIELASDKIIIGSEGNGIFQINKDDTISPFYLGGKNLKGQLVLNMILTTNNNLWFATQDGIHLYDLNTEQWHKLNLGHKVYNLMEGPYHSIYAATKKGLIHVHLGDNRLEFTQLLSDKYKIRDFVRVANLIYLASEENGILIYDLDTKEVKTIGVQEGLSTRTFYNIILQGEHLYSGSYDGLYQINLNTHEFYKFNKEDGLSDLEFNTNSKLNLNNSEILLGTQNGLTQINTASLKKELHPFKTYMHHISFVDKNGISQRLTDINFQDQITFPAESHQIIFYLGSSSYAHPGLNKYFIKFDRESIYKLSEENQIIFPYLPAGNYEIEINGLNDRYNWSDNSIKLNFNIEQTFLKSIYFKLLIVIMILFVSLIVIYNKKNYQNLILKTKHEFAANLHDEIGGDLTAIKLKSEMIKTHTSEETKQELDTISEIVQNTILNTSDLIWSIQMTDRKLETLINRMEKLADIRLKGTEFNYFFHTSHSNLNLNLKQEHIQHIYLIYKESLSNFMKYSKFRTFDIKLKTHQGSLEIIISQNGEHTTGIERNSTYGGHGMRNMITRTKQIGGTINFTKDSNWTIQINIPKP